MSEYRCYHFGNFYLSGIQQGIQAAHGQTNMFLKYPQKDYVDPRIIGPTNILYTWAEIPTTILLNGGNNFSLNDVYATIHVDENPYPYSCFQEDEESLNGLLTNVAIILPEKIYNAYDEFKKSFSYWIEPDRRYRCVNFEEFIIQSLTHGGRINKHFDELREYEKEHDKFTEWEAQMVDFLRKFRLAC